MEEAEKRLEEQGEALPDDEEVEESDESSESEIEVAVTARERRANAGNRLRALLDDEGVEEEEMFKEEANDQDFEGKGSFRGQLAILGHATDIRINWYRRGGRRL
jgi:uncharacterized protein involved in exopolysaccharide biosynthesis